MQDPNAFTYCSIKAEYFSKNYGSRQEKKAVCVKKGELVYFKSGCICSLERFLECLSAKWYFGREEAACLGKVQTCHLMSFISILHALHAQYVFQVCEIYLVSRFSNRRNGYNYKRIVESSLLLFLPEDDSSLSQNIANCLVSLSTPSAFRVSFSLYISVCFGTTSSMY